MMKQGLTQGNTGKLHPGHWKGNMINKKEVDKPFTTEIRNKTKGKNELTQTCSNLYVISSQNI